MKDIKFRVWLEEIKTMQHSDKLSFFFKDYEGTPIMQFIGLKDKNGKDIFEGDIVDSRIDDPEWTCHSYNIVTDGWYVWNDGEYEHHIYGIHKRSTYVNSSDPCEPFEHQDSRLPGNTVIEVVGNIYENPKLLTD